MVIDMNEERLVTLPQLRQFIEGTTEVELDDANRTRLARRPSRSRRTASDG